MLPLPANSITINVNGTIDPAAIAEAVRNELQRAFGERQAVFCPVTINVSGVDPAALAHAVRAELARLAQQNRFLGLV